MMIDSVCVVGTGRVGTAVAARLRERGHPVAVAGRSLHTGSAGLVVLCVPDREIAPVAAAIAPGPWVAHVSGATPLAALAPHARRFGVHPLQSLSLDRGPEQLDGAWGAVGGETPEALAMAHELAGLLGLRPFELADRDRAAYHAAAAFGANFTVTLYHAAARLLEGCGVPPEALAPLVRRVVDNGFALTGPIQRGDRATVEAHLAALAERAPELEPLYRLLARATVDLVPGSRADALPAGVAPAPEAVPA